MRQRLLQILRRFTWSPLICFGLAYLLMQTEAMRHVAWRTLDWRTNLRVYFQPPPDPRIAIDAGVEGPGDPPERLVAAEAGVDGVGTGNHGWGRGGPSRMLP